MKQEIQVQKDNAPMAVESGSTAMMEIISRAAADSSVDIDKLERLLEMKERMDAKNSELEFNSALAKMQIAIPSIAERGVADRGRAGSLSYAKLEDILDVVRPIMHQYGFAVVFKMTDSEASVSVTGSLMHSGGHSIETSLRLPFDMTSGKNSVQAVGSAISYGKRYVLNALLNITTRGQDDDGFAAVPFVALTKMQQASIQGLLDKCKESTQANFKSVYGEVNEIGKADFNKVTNELRAAVKRDGVV